MTKKIFGIHAVTGMLSHDSKNVESVMLSAQRRDKRLAEIESLASSKNVACTRVSIDMLNKSAQGVRHQGVVAMCRESAARQKIADASQLLALSSQPAFIVALDGIEDPRNLGACLRSADAGGAQGVLLPRNRGCGITDTVSRTAVGSAESLPIAQVANLARALDDLKSKGVWVIGMDASASQSVFETSFIEPCAIVFGSENAGLRRMTREKCDQMAKIPMAGSVESFNVSVAVGIVAVEVARQRAQA